MKNIFLLPQVAVVVKRSACGCLRANQASVCGHWSPAFNTYLGNEKATSSTLWTFSHLSALSIITVPINCMAVHRHELKVWPTLQRKTEFLEGYTSIHRTSSIVTDQEGFQ